MNSAKLYCQNGEIRDISPSNGTDFTLEEMQQHVGGYVEVVTLQNGMLMCLDEDGKFKDYRYNWKATHMAHAQRVIMPCDIIVGNVVVCSAEMFR